MAYEEYQRKWLIKTSDDPNCSEGDLVTFEVIITCGGRRPYVEGAYVPASNTIAAAGDYEIHITKGSPSTISFTRREGGSIAGSWTAEDEGAWPGDG